MRYGQDDLLLQVYIRELLKLVISNMNSKEMVPFKKLFLKLDFHLRALKSLDLEKADPATWLLPLVESSLPEDILYSWQRSLMSSYDGSKGDPPRTRLDILLECMGKEVQILQRLEITKGFAVEFKVEHKCKKSIHNCNCNPERASMAVGGCIVFVFPAPKCLNEISELNEIQLEG